MSANARTCPHCGESDFGGFVTITKRKKCGEDMEPGFLNYCMGTGMSYSGQCTLEYWEKEKYDGKFRKFYDSGDYTFSYDKYGNKGVAYQYEKCFQCRGTGTITRKERIFQEDLRKSAN